MPTLAEIPGLWADDQLRAKVEAAMTVVANEVESEDPGTANHAGRLALANRSCGRWSRRTAERQPDKVEPTYPLLQAKCARCHSGDQPKGGVTLDGTRPVPAEVALTSLRMLRDRKGPDEMASVLAGLKDADLPGLMQELLEVSK